MARHHTPPPPHIAFRITEDGAPHLHAAELADKFDALGRQGFVGVRQVADIEVQQGNSGGARQTANYFDVTEKES